jgi:hypothetical protein
VNIKLLISISYSLGKVFHYDFLVMTRKVEISKSCPMRDRDFNESCFFIAGIHNVEGLK